jgi:hypothetical protein
MTSGAQQTTSDKTAVRPFQVGNVPETAHCRIAQAYHRDKVA